MADAEITATQTHAAPLNYQVPGAQEILLKVASATFDGSGAGGKWQPAIQLIGPSGQVLRTFALATVLAAGASADVTFFPLGGVGETEAIFGTSYIGAFQQADQPLNVPPFGTTAIWDDPPDYSAGTDLSVTSGGGDITVNVDGWYSLWWSPTISGFDATSRGQVVFSIPSANIPQDGWWGAVGPSFPTLEIFGNEDSLAQDFTPSLIYSVPPVNYTAGQNIAFSVFLAPTWAGTKPNLDQHSNVFVCRVA
jgi:hypothetical protein